MKRQNLLRTAGFLVILVILLQVFSIVFDGGYWFQKKLIYDRNARIAALDLEPEGQIDVINIGDSLSTSALSPVDLYRDYGITSYNLGQDMQTPVEGYFAILTALKKQPVRVVLLENHTFFYRLKDYNYISELVSEPLKTGFPFLRFHYLWRNYWKKRSIRTYYKGFLVNDDHDAYTGGEYYDWNNEGRAYIYWLHELMLRRIAALCRRKGIALVLYSAPSPVNHRMTIHNKTSDLAEELGIYYIDANYDRDLISIDWEQDTNDFGDHLNLTGSQKMTRYIGDFLAENFSLPDHREDPSYRSWSDLIASYEETCREMKGTCYSLMEEALGFDD